VRNLSLDWNGIAVFGPRSRELMGVASGSDFSAQAAPFMSARRVEFGGADALTLRLSVTGELGYEIHAPPAQIAKIYDVLAAHAPEYGIVNVGMYCLLSLRMEKGFGIWSREFSRDYTPAESGLARFVDYDRPGFIGREAAIRDRESHPNRRLALLEIEASEAEASFYEPVWAGQSRVGFVTSAAFGHCCNMSLALAYIDTSVAPQSLESLRVTILGEPRNCRVLQAPPVDPQGQRMRG